MLIEGIAGRFLQKLTGVTSARITQLGSLAYGEVEGERDEMTRAGMRFTIATSGATGIAPVQALPSTAAQWLLYMPTSSSTSAYVDWLGMWLVSGTAGTGGTTVCAPVGLPNVPSTTPTMAANVALLNHNSGSRRGSNLIVASNQTLVGTSNFWSPLAYVGAPSLTLLGQTQMEQRDLRGGYLIAPGTGLGLAVIAPTGTTPLYAPYGSYREYATDIE